MGGYIFSKKGPHNRPLELKHEPKFQTQTTMPKFMEYLKEDNEVQIESVASWEEKYASYQALSEECRRVLPFKYFFENKYREYPL